MGGTSTPAGSWETALSAIVSKLRASLRPHGASVATAAGCDQLTLPSDAWVDVEEARHALECLAAVASSNGEHPLAAQLAREVVELEPFRETGWQRLMRALADGGNRAEALRAYALCRALLAKEMGVAPSKETEAIVTGMRV